MKISHNEYEIDLDSQGTQSIRITFNQAKDEDDITDWEHGSYVVPHEMINPIIARLKDLKNELKRNH